MKPNQTENENVIGAGLSGFAVPKGLPARGIPVSILAESARQYLARLVNWSCERRRHRRDRRLLAALANRLLRDVGLEHMITHDCDREIHHRRL
jgi:uncharacterized protein YjiS (DUF1127 family)